MTDIETLIERIDGAPSLVVREDSAAYGLWDRLKSRLVEELQLSSDLVESWEDDAGEYDTTAASSLPAGIEPQTE